jgi:hypothetical protein
MRPPDPARRAFNFLPREKAEMWQSVPTKAESQKSLLAMCLLGVTGGSGTGFLSDQ